ncbi:ATP-binding cassette domain-containing protein [Ligilactobacillus apodemi]|uniref:ATP-binding cassette domain-containing protein n=1 Tax=Ligilactobacillus apodemi TaxID=307126 RepID=UPI00214BAA00|nr:ATP-binding cassette domain-containing protein [Ligilactobacillus apodemi]MCR1900678.1 ATP-binding cassette domain-containing protein [Ligilactobacillus apodemi]
MEHYEIVQLSKHLTDFYLANISFSANKGDIIGLIGKNGVGKTTLLNALAGIERADFGQILVDGKVAKRTFFTTEVDYLPDKLDLYDYLTLQENIDFVLKVRELENDETKRYLAELLVELELADQLKTRLKDLSKGMRQKFNFIVTILHRSKLLLLDEPFDGLDPKQIMVLKNYSGN